MCEVIVDEVEGEGVKEEEGEEGAGWWTMDINFGSRLNSMFNVPVGLGHFFPTFNSEVAGTEEIVVRVK